MHMNQNDKMKSAIFKIVLATVFFFAGGVASYFYLARSTQTDRDSECLRLIEETNQEEIKLFYGDPYAAVLIADLQTETDSKCGRHADKLKRQYHIEYCREQRTEFKRQTAFIRVGNVFAPYGLDELTNEIHRACPELSSEVEDELRELAPQIEALRKEFDD